MLEARSSVVVCLFCRKHIVFLGAVLPSQRIFVVLRVARIAKSRSGQHNRVFETTSFSSQK